MSNDNALLRRRLTDEEGLKLEVYLDSVKKLPHIGIGHNLALEQSEEELAILGPSYNENDHDNFTITEQQAHDLFDLDVEEAINDIFPFFTHEQLNDLGETRRAIIIEMTFQMGGGSLRKFKKFKEAILQENWEAAAHEMVTGSLGGPSKWLQQTKDRCLSAAEAMKVGYFVEYMDSPPLPKETKPNELTGIEDAELIAHIRKVADELERRLGI